ncbi:MAG: MoxR family ATPase [Lachnospiraceae bacterium]|nr:MoxR family ATPase [Lachnospiraceae bacterium]
MQNNLQKIVMAQKEIEKVVKGKSQKISKIIAAILAKGHILLEDVPGVGKTTTALAFSKVMNLSYGRVQFTPDVLPTDITGFSMFNKQTGAFEYKRGAVMCNLFLADEINRTSPKTQSALLQVMEERKITIDGKNFVIPEPFIVIATQNPLGSAGTQKLPDSQLDRFMIKISMGYPDKKNEIDILKGGSDAKKYERISQILTSDDILSARADVDAMHVADNVYEYIEELITATRECEYVKVGLSTRAGIALTNLAKSYAYLTGKSFVTPEDVVRAFYDVSEHRLALNNKAKMNNMDCKKVLDFVRSKVEVPIVQTVVNN